MTFWVVLFAIFVVVCVASFLIFEQYKKIVREAKNYERALKMVPMRIYLPPPSDDIDASSRDERDVVDEVLSEAQTMYNIISSTATKGFKTKIYGQRHISFEIIANEGLIHYYAVVPAVLTETIKQAVTAAYPTARLEEAESENIFSKQGKSYGVIGGEFSLSKEFYYPIATYKDTRRDAVRAILDSISNISRGDGVAIQFMIRPAKDGWTKSSIEKIGALQSGKKKKGVVSADLLEALWKPPEYSGSSTSLDKPVSPLDNDEIEAIKEKINYPGYETLIRVIVSSDTAARSQAILQSIVAAFALFDSPRFNKFKFHISNNIDELITSYIFRFFPQSVNTNILNSVELATLFHLPSKNAISTEKVQRQRIKQVDGPTEPMESGLLIGVNEFRGVEKQIRLSINDRRRHTYIIGQTGMGKSKFLENLAYQDIMNGDGFCFIDPHGDSVEELMGMIPKERADDVIYFNPSDIENPLGFNIFEAESQDQMDFVIAETNSMLKALYDPGNTGVVGPRMENIVRNAAILLMSDPNGGTFMDIPKVLVDPEFTKPKIKYLTNQRAIDFWTKEWPASQKSSDAGELVSWVVSKWAPFESGLINNILGQKKSAFNIREIMDNKKILLVNLSKGLLGEQPAKLLGMVFVMKFQAAAMSRADTPEHERKDFCLYVDEFQNFATDSFESILSEARKYRLNLVLANQFMTQLKDSIKGAIMGNVPNKIVGRIGIEDAEILQKAFTPTFTAEDLIKTPNYNAIVTMLIDGVPTAPFTMKLLPPIGKSNPELREALKRYSASKYGRDRRSVEAEIRERLAVKPKIQQVPKSNVSFDNTQQNIPPVNTAKDIRPVENTSPRVEPAINTPPKVEPKIKISDDFFLDNWIKKREELKKAEINNSNNNDVGTVATNVNTSNEKAAMNKQDSIDHPVNSKYAQPPISTSNIAPSPEKNINTDTPESTQGMASQRHISDELSVHEPSGEGEVVIKIR